MTQSKGCVMVAGGAGYIGSHVTLALVEAGYQAVVLDDLSTGSVEAIRRVSHLGAQDIPLIKASILDPLALEEAFSSFPFSAVILLAGKKSPSESLRDPTAYFETNLSGLINVTRALRAYGVRNVVFSSSATVYGQEARAPVDENALTNPATAYGDTKLMGEKILSRGAESGLWNVVNLRYFNPVGAHPTGLIGEDPATRPTNLFPIIAQAAISDGHVGVYGDDYPTEDGSGIRDFVHVSDLAAAHVKSIDLLQRNPEPGSITLNLGTGRGTSVFEAIAAWRKITGKPIPIEILGRRDGDIAVSFTDPSKAQRQLGWKAERSLDTMCRDHWRWVTQNPVGYGRSI